MSPTSTSQARRTKCLIWSSRDRRQPQHSLTIVSLTSSKEWRLFKRESSSIGRKTSSGSIITRDPTFMRIFRGTTIRGLLPKDTFIRGMRTITRMIFKNNLERISFVTFKKILIGRSQSPSIARISSIATTICTRILLIIEGLKLYIEGKISYHNLDPLYKHQKSIQIDIS